MAIITDASGDIPPEIEEKYNVTIVPVLMFVDEKQYTSEGIEKGFTWEEFYKVTEDKVPRTAIPGPGIFMKKFEEALEIGDSVIGVFISEKLSGVYNSAALVAREYLEGKDVKVYHAGVNSVGVGVVVLEAARLAAEGKSMDEITKKVESWIENVRYAGIINKLENLVKTGRLSKAKKFFADILKFKPVLGFEENEIHVYGNLKADDALIVETMKKFGEKVLVNMVDDNNTLYIAHSQWPEAAEEIKAHLEKQNPKSKEILIQQTGVINAFYTGKKLLAFGYIGKFDSDWLLKAE
ncbi:MAG: DegV family protein [Candidatus Heimdallarchaeota archaeon]